MKPTHLLPSISSLDIKRMRIQKGMKQGNFAHLFGVSQSTVSKWENGTLQLSTQQLKKLRSNFNAKLDPNYDQWLRRLIENSGIPVHLMCETSHFPLAASGPRLEEWGCDLNDMMDRPLSADLPEDIFEAEINFSNEIMNQPKLRYFKTETVGRKNGNYRINPAKMVWERTQLSGGEWVRVVTNLD